ncbi:MAG TPA: hypothetical protein VF171_05320 [Trueperaceae bacterium]
MIRRLLGLALCLALAPCAALAQGQDAFMERYALAVTSLDESVSALPADSARSLEKLELAASVLRPLSEETSSDTLIGDMQSTFERARTAITNGSQTDLAVQAALLKGGFERIAYEAALREARAGNRDLAQSRLAAVATDMELPQATLDAFRGGPLAQLQLTFERGVAGAMSKLVGEASDLAPQDVAGAYRKLATAYGHYIPIQDSPRISTAVGSSFVEAFNALVAEEADELPGRFDSLLQQAEALQRAVNATFDELGLSGAPTPATASPIVPGAPEPAGPPAAASPVLPDTASAPTPVPAPHVASAATKTHAAETDDVSSAAPAVPETAPEATAPEAATLAPAPTVRPEVLTLQRELAPYRLSPTQQNRLVDLYLHSGLRSVDDALDSLYATGARALVALKMGQADEARSLLSAFSGDYALFVEPLLETTDSDVNNATFKLMRALEGAPALRTQDAAALLEQTQVVAAALDGQQPSDLHRFSVSVHRIWAGGLRLSIMILLGILAFLPLYLLNLAFGGGNRNWRWIGVSLFLLLLPVIYQGLAFLGSLLAGLTGMPALDVLATFSPFEDTLAQLVWVILTIVAIGFALAGLYGICVQFGLLGRGQNASGPGSSPRLTATDPMPGSVVDWDEEF